MLNSSIAKVLADLGHTDTIVIGDCGLPVPAGVQKIDLALKPGTPSFLEVVEEVAKNMVIEKVEIAAEMEGRNPAVYGAMKQLFTEEQWIIEPLDNKYKADDKLVTSAAANSEILFSLMVNPNVLGAGMPGGTYAGNQGGSNIREAFLVNIAMAWLDRQNLLDPIEAMLEFNGVKDIQLRFRNTILTTLDSGSGTTKNLA